MGAAKATNPPRAPSPADRKHLPRRPHHLAAAPQSRQLARLTVTASNAATRSRPLSGRPRPLRRAQTLEAAAPGSLKRMFGSGPRSQQGFGPSPEPRWDVWEGRETLRSAATPPSSKGACGSKLFYAVILASVARAACFSLLANNRWNNTCHPGQSSLPSPGRQGGGG